MDSKSSRRDVSTPWWFATDAYLGVPVKLLPSLYGMCCNVCGCRYRLLSPKSMQKTMAGASPCVTTKFAGFISLCIKSIIC